jgi:hypothetical protein
MRSISAFGKRGLSNNTASLSAGKNRKKKENDMPIVIKAERIHSVNGDAWKLLEIDMLDSNALPAEYMKGLPRVFKNGYWTYVKKDNSDANGYAPNNILTSSEFDDLLETCRLAGERLADIHKRIWSPSWTGTETFKI